MGKRYNIFNIQMLENCSLFLKRLLKSSLTSWCWYGGSSLYTGGGQVGGSSISVPENASFPSCCTDR